MHGRDDTFEGLRALSAFDGDSAAAGRALHSYLARHWHDVAVALLLVRGAAAGQCRLAGLIGPDGAELFPVNDPLGRADLPRFDDELSRRLVGGRGPHAVDLAPNERGAPLAQALLGPASLLALPMPNEGRVDHWLVLASDARHRFEGTDPNAALRDATLAYALLTRPLALRTITAEARRHHREIEGLADVQRLLHPDNPAIRGLDYAIHWQPADTAAGDYYDLMPLPESATGGDAWGVMLADVSGHGAAAAMETVQFDAILRTYAGTEPPGGPAGVLNYANRYFFSRRHRRHFMTIFGAGCQPEQDMLTYICAGHPPAVHRRGDQVTLLGQGDDAGIPLGILRDHRWENASAEFRRGDLLVLYTDGMIEARDASGNAFGIERLAALVGSGDPAPAATMARVRDAVHAHQGGSVGIDDQTLIALRRLP